MEQAPCLMTRLPAAPAMKIRVEALQPGVPNGAVTVVVRAPVTNAAARAPPGISEPEETRVRAEGPDGRIGGVKEGRTLLWIAGLEVGQIEMASAAPPC
jgi:hypothetical protein